MGATVKTLSRIIDLRERGLLPPGAAILDLGVQEINAKGSEDYIREFIEYFSSRDGLKSSGSYTRKEISRFANQCFLGALLEACGFEYRSIDLFEAYNTILFDLNRHRPPEDLRGHFDLVTNLGTTEHVINQSLAMKSIHDLTKPGGLIYHDLPMSGYYLHGYFSYNPLFFQHLAIANDYETILESYSMEPGRTTPRFMIENGYPDARFCDYGVEYIVRKTTDRAFRMPFDPATSVDPASPIWAEAGQAGGDGVVPAVAALSRGGYSLAQTASLERVSGWSLQRELLRRYRKRITRWFGR